MKSKNSEKEQAAKKYVESQLDVLRKHGTEVSQSSKKAIIRQVSRASA
jgi:hypothetical protein